MDRSSWAYRSCGGFPTLLQPSVGWKAPWGRQADSEALAEGRYVGRVHTGNDHSDWLAVLRPKLVETTGRFGVARASYVRVSGFAAADGAAVAGHVELCQRVADELVAGDVAHYPEGWYEKEPFVNEWYRGPCQIQTSVLVPTSAADLLNRVHQAIEDIAEADLLGAQAVLLTGDPYPKFLLKAFVLPPLEDDDNISDGAAASPKT